MLSRQWHPASIDVDEVNSLDIGRCMVAGDDRFHFSSAMGMVGYAGLRRGGTLVLAVWNSTESPADHFAHAAGGAPPR
jgi:hypothetical protein